MVAHTSPNKPSGATLMGGDDRARLLMAAPLIVGAMLWLYGPLAVWLWWSWNNDEYYGHGMLLPFISAFLIWQKREALRDAWRTHAKSDSSPWLLLGGLALQLIGVLSDVGTVQAFSIPVVLLGMARLLGGRQFARILRFPLLYLWMAVPLSTVLIQSLTVPMQNNSAAWAAMLLGLLGVPITRDGVNLITPAYSFIVAVPCNGLKTTITLLTLALLVVHLLPNLTRWKRVLLVLMSVPIALIANALRIMTIVLIGTNFGREKAEGFFHEGSGLFVFALSLGLLLLAGNLLASREEVGEGAPLSTLETAPEGPLNRARFASLLPTTTGRLALILICLLSMRGVGWLMTGSDSPDSIKTDKIVLAMPLKVEAWRGTPVKVDQVVFDVLRPDAAVQARYELPASARQSATQVQSIAIFSRNQSNFHNPTMCLTADGWAVANDERRTLSNGRDSLQVNVITAERGGQRRQLAYIFTDARQESTAWLPTMMRLAGTRLLRGKGGAFHLQFAYDGRVLLPNGQFTPQFTALILNVTKSVRRQIS